jgi:hypothetical protein
VLVLGVLRASAARAETVAIAGVPFAVDRLVAVGSEKVTVRLGDKEVLIRRSDLDDFVVRETLSSDERASRMSDRLLVRFAESALSLRPAWTALALRVVRERSVGDNADLVETITALREDRARVDAFREAAKGVLAPVRQPDGQPRATTLLVVAVGRDDPAWLTSHAAEYLRSLEEPIKDLVIKEAHEALRLRDMERASRLWGFLSSAYGPSDTTARALAERLVRVREVATARSAGDIAALARAASPDPGDPIASELIIPPALEGLHALATQAIETGRIDVGLDILAQINPLVRTESTHELCRVALERIGPPMSAAIVRAEVLNFIDVVALNDQRVETAYARALAGQTIARIEAGSMQDAEALVARLVRLKGVDQATKDGVFLRLARGYLARNDFEFAERTLNQTVSAGLGGWFLRLRLSFVRMSAGSFALLLVLLIVLGVGLIVSLSRRRGDASPELEAPSRIEVPPGTPRPQRRVETPVEEEPLQEFVVAEHRRMSPSAQEYQRCLQILGLPLSADARAIKNAYRTLVKDVHPDRNRSNDDATSARFIELTRVYDRVLELRREFGYED